MHRNDMQLRAIATTMKTRAEPDSDELIIEGYFAVFGKETMLWKDAYEEIAQGAFTETIKDDVRALINHDTTLVIGRTKANTLTLEETKEGLYGVIKINQNDTDALNLYERVKRGDVDQCSFGFDIINEETDWREDGSVKWTIKEVKLYEISICTFPAYNDTSVQARGKEVELRKQQCLQKRKKELKERFKKWH